MILTSLVGNSNTRFVWFRGSRVARMLVMPTSAVRRGLLPRTGPVSGVALASVVPSVTRRVWSNLRAATGMEPFVVGSRTRTGLTFHYRRDQLGADRVCACVGAHGRFPRQDLIVFDFGTATTVNVVMREGTFAGGAILPGIRMSLDALAAGTAGLPSLTPGRSTNPVQHNTRAAVQAGVGALFVGGVENIIDRAERDLKRSFLVVSTGGAAAVARRYTTRIGTIRPNLASEGLAGIWYLNRGT
ncbi:MAG TPA: type III pantothenate kinase [bacterium]|nr:type III pantothenate kinase [bacterium]